MYVPLSWWIQQNCRQAKMFYLLIVQCPTSSIWTFYTFDSTKIYVLNSIPPIDMYGEIFCLPAETNSYNCTEPHKKHLSSFSVMVCFSIYLSMLVRAESKVQNLLLSPMRTRLWGHNFKDTTLRTLLWGHNFEDATLRTQLWGHDFEDTTLRNRSFEEPSLGGHNFF